MLSPNPFDLFLVAEFEEGTTFPVDVFIRTTDGALLIRDRVFTSKKIISTADLAPGFYHIRMENELGELLDTHYRKNG